MSHTIQNKAQFFLCGDKSQRFYLWNQVREHGAALHSHHLLQAVQSELGGLLVVLATEIQSG